MKRIKDTGKAARKIDTEKLAKALGASEVTDIKTGKVVWSKVMIYKGFDPETMAWQIIDDKDFDTLLDVLKELQARRREAAHKSPWCECGRSELKGSCSVCDYEE